MNLSLKSTPNKLSVKIETVCVINAFVKSYLPYVEEIARICKTEKKKKRIKRNAQFVTFCVFLQGNHFDNPEFPSTGG